MVHITVPQAQSGGDDADLGASAISHVGQNGLHIMRNDPYNALQGSLGRQHSLSIASLSVLVQCSCTCTTWITESSNAPAGAGLLKI